MLYHLFQYLESLDLPGAGIFQYITFRSGCAIILSLIIATVVGKRVIRLLQRQQIGEEIRDLGLEGQMEKKRYSYDGRGDYFVSNINSGHIVCSFGQYLYPTDDYINNLVGINRFC